MCGSASGVTSEPPGGGGAGGFDWTNPLGGSADPEQKKRLQQYKAMQMLSQAGGQGAGGGGQAPTPGAATNAPPITQLQAGPVTGTTIPQGATGAPYFAGGSPNPAGFGTGGQMGGLPGGVPGAPIQPQGGVGTFGVPTGGIFNQGGVAPNVPMTINAIGGPYNRLGAAG
jgi:hypothetical protein